MVAIDFIEVEREIELLSALVADHKVSAAWRAAFNKELELKISWRDRIDAAWGTPDFMEVLNQITKEYQNEG